MPPRSGDRSKASGASDVSTDVLMQVAQSIGKVEGTVSQMNERLGELAEAQRSLAVGQDRFIEENAHQHQQMSERLSSMETRLGDGDRRFDEHHKRLAELELAQQQKKPPDRDSLDIANKILDFGKRWWPGIMIFFGAVYTALERYFRGGSSQ
jgi:chromosome segregation ATPase